MVVPPDKFSTPPLLTTVLLVTPPVRTNALPWSSRVAPLATPPDDTVRAPTESAVTPLSTLRDKTVLPQALMFPARELPDTKSWPPEESVAPLPTPPDD